MNGGKKRLVSNCPLSDSELTKSRFEPRPMYYANALDKYW